MISYLRHEPDLAKSAVLRQGCQSKTADIQSTEIRRRDEERVDMTAPIQPESRHPKHSAPNTAHPIGRVPRIPHTSSSADDARKASEDSRGC